MARKLLLIPKKLTKAIIPNLETQLKLILKITEQKIVKGIASRYSLNKAWTEKKEILSRIEDIILSEYTIKMQEKETKETEIKTRITEFLKKIKFHDRSPNNKINRSKRLQYFYFIKSVYQLRKENKIGTAPVRDSINKLREGIDRYRMHKTTGMIEKIKADLASLEKTVSNIDLDKVERKGNKIQYFRSSIKELRKTKGAETVRYLTRHYSNDIAADFNPAFYSVFIKLAEKFLLKNIAKSVKIRTEKPDTLDRIKELIKDYQVFLIPNHISNTDQGPIVLACNWMGLPHPTILAGKNLDRGLAKLVLSSMGATKLRRDEIKQEVKWFHNPLYRKTFKTYNKVMWRLREQPYLFYMEGGRSREGTFVEPKTGIFSQILDYVKNDDKPVVFVPIALSYNIVSEDRDIDKSLKNKHHDISNVDFLTQIIKFDRGYKNEKESSIYVNLLEPVMINPESLPEEISKEYVKDFAGFFMRKINENIVLTSTYKLGFAIMRNIRKSKGINYVDMNEVKKFYIDNIDNLFDCNGKTPEEIADMVGTEFRKGMEILIKRGFITYKKGSWNVLNEGVVQQYANRGRYKLEKIVG